MKKENKQSNQRPAYSGRMDVNALLALDQMALENRVVDNQRTAIMLDKAGMAGKAIASGAYELIKAPFRGAYNLAALGVQAGVGLAGVAANTAIGIGSAIMQGYIALANAPDSEGNQEGDEHRYANTPRGEARRYTNTSEEEARFTTVTV
ncbi:MAG: hypothetical protein Q7R87_00930 [Nanoarchaeota archaeon]|nr:hypothetical protein [Nanoarchaeota archaeon]